MKVLYIEDNVDDAYLAKRELARKAPHILVEIKNKLGDARAILANDPTYDLVLCDLNLPDGNGLEFLSEIREQGLPLAVVILTGQSDEEIAVAALKAGADDYLGKREDYLTRLPSVIEAALARFRAEATKNAGKLRVLYAEHDTADIDLTRRHMEKHSPHIRLDVVSSTQAALQKLPSDINTPCPYDVFLLDFHLPGENAFEVLKIVHDERHLDLPVVLVTGQGDDEVAAQALRLGASDYLVKHANYLYALPAALENAFFRSRLAREEAALRESEARYRLIVENSTFSIVVHSDNKIVLANRTAARTIGATAPEELYGRNIIEFVHPEERPKIMGLIQNAIDPSQDILASEPLVVEERLIRLDGSIVSVEASAIPIDYYGKSGLLVMMNNITERKRAEKAIQESEAKFRSYIEHAPLPFFVTNERGNYLELNKAAEELLGYDEATLKRLTVLDVTSDEDRDRAFHDFSAIFDQGYVEGEYRLKKRAGGLVWVNLRAVKLNGNRAIAFCQDITERKAAEQALLNQVKLQDQLAKVAASVPGMIASLRLRPDGSTCMPYSTSALEDLYGLQPEDVLEDAAPALSLIHPDDMPHVLNAMEESARNLTPFRDEWRVRHPRRGEIWVEGHTMPLREADGGTLWHGFIQDVTERKHGEQNLKDREAQYRAVIETSTDGFWMVDTQGRFLEVNDAYVKRSGYRREELLKMRISDVEAKERPEETAAHIKSIKDIGVGRFETQHRTKDGSIWDVEINTSYWPIGDEVFFVFLRDITERKRSVEALRKSEERYRSLFENMLGGYAYCRMMYDNGQPEDFVYLEVNKAFEPLTGLKNVVGKKVTELIPGIKATNPEVFEIYSRVAMTGKPEMFEDYIGGLNVWLSISVYSPERGTFVAIFENINERKRAEEALRQSEQRLALHVQKTPVAVIEWDNHFQVVKWNPAAESIFGYTASEAMGRHGLFLVPEINQQQINQTWEKLINQQGGERATNENLTRDGKTIICEWHNTPLVTSDGKIIGAASMVQDITERMQAEVALKISEENYRSLIENSESAIAIINREGQILYMNPGGIQIWEDSQIVGKSIFDVYPREYALRYSTAIKQVIDSQTGIVDDVESLINDHLMWFRISMSPLRNPDGTVNTLVLNAWNITKRKLAEEELQFRNIILSTQQETSIDGILVVDDKNRILSYNRRFTEMWNVPAPLIENGIDEPILQFNAAQVADPEPFLQRVQDLYGRKKETSQDELLLADGRVFERYSAPMFGSDERYFGRVWYFRDATERKRAEAELLKHRDHLEELVKERTAKLAESEASLRKYSEEISDLYQNAPCGYQSLDENGTFLGINDTELKWLGYTREELVGKKKISDILSPQSLIHYQKEFQEFKKRGSLQDFEQEMIRKDGTSIPVLINATALFDGNGNFIMSRETLLDNTERIRAEKALRDSIEVAESANRAKSIFLANMSHEIRTPMNAILGFTQLMLREPGLSADQEQHLDTINRSGEHLLGLINDILEMSKIEANRVTLNHTIVDLHAMVRDLEMMFKPRTEEKNVQFKVEVDPNLPVTVSTDGNKLRQIMINLLSNAFKFTNQGWICWRIRTVKKGRGQLYLYSEVEDTGPGIAPEEKGILFQAFGQTSTGISAGSGTGLGLAISSRYAQMMGGDLSVTSEVGKGSIFHLEVKIDKVAKGEVEYTPAKRRGVRLKKNQHPFRVLVVDDQKDNRILVAQLLKEAGFNPREAVNGKEAVEVTLEWQPHLILMDIRMPIMDGYEAIHRIRLSEQGRNIPIIAITASAFSDDEKEALRSGANAYIRKPFKEQELFQAIETCLGVQFEHKDESMEKSHQGEVAVIIPGGMPTDFPQEWIEPLRQATLTANLDRLMTLIDQIGQKSPQIADRLRHLANQYQYDELLILFQQGKTL